MGDPNPNHFLVHSALVLLRHWWCRDRAAKLPKSGYRGNQRNHRYRSANLRLVGQNVGFHRSSSSWCSSCFSDFFWKVVWNKKKRHTHTHIGSSVFNNLSLSPEPLAPRKKSIPQKTTTCETKNLPNAHTHALFRWDNWSAIALICWSFLPCVVPVSLVWLHRLRRLPLGALRWPLLVEKVPWNGKW